MAEWSQWVACDNLQRDDFGSQWNSVANASVDDSSFSFATAINGQWQGSPAHNTEVIGSFTNNLKPLVPLTATISRIETRFHFILPTTLLVIPFLRIYDSDSLGTLIETIGTIGPAAEQKQITHQETVSNAIGWNMVNGTSATMYMKGYHLQEEAATWQLNLRYIEARVEFTRAPNVPRTAFIGLF